MRLFLVLIFLMGLSACTTLNRDPRSGYADSSESVNDFYQERVSKEEADTREELGFNNRPLSDGESARLEQRLHLHRLEGQLQSKRDRKQYYSVRNYMRSDQERIGFLNLQTYEAKQRYLQNRGMLKDAETYSEPVAKAIESQDITVGMSSKAVRESWGDPDLVETAGDPLYGYERWNYHKMVAGSEGYQKDLRIVYFEGGRVVGWETPN